MSVSDPDVVDFVGADRASGDVVLTISDHLEWGSLGVEHASVLEAKLEAYLRFLESGQILEEYPKAKGRRVRIEILQKYSPDASGQERLAALRAEIGRRGYHLSWRVPEWRDGQSSDAEAG